MNVILFNDMLVKHVVEVFLRVGNVEAGPPLGTVLGNAGVNTTKFCKDFNDFTKELPDYFVLKVRIFIFENRTCSFVVFAPTVSFILGLLKFQKTINVYHFDRLHERLLICVIFFELLKLSLFKHSSRFLGESLNSILGTVHSFNLSVSLN